MQPYIDPLDLEPKISAESLRSAAKQRETTTKNGETFEDVFQQQIKQEPTPVWVPKPITVEPAVSITVSKPIEHDTVPTQNALLTASAVETDPVAPKPIEHNRPNSLREMLQPVKSDEIAPVQPEPTLINEEINVPVVDPAIIEQDEPTQIKQDTTPSPFSDSYIIQHGDTLSDIVASRLKDQGAEYTVRDLYRIVREVAQHNGLHNPDRIFAGNKVDLSPINQYEPQIVNLSMAQPQSMAAGTGIGEVTSEFGMRRHPILNEIRHHDGIDIRADEGTPVLPAKTGVITFSGEQPGYGQTIDIDHGDGTLTRYAHLSERLAAAGDLVNPQQPIALSGSTGNATGPHLHFEYHENGEPVDPSQHIHPEALLAQNSPIMQHGEPVEF